MRSLRVWAWLLRVEQAVVESVDLDSDGRSVVVSVRPCRGAASRCAVCGRRCPGFDRGQGRRRWRTFNVGVVRCYLEADAPRVRCRQHGVRVAAVPWARPGAGHTRGFDEQVACEVPRVSRTTTKPVFYAAS